MSWVHEAFDADAFRARAIAASRESIEAVIAHHTTPEQAGEVFSQVKPRLAVYSHAPDSERIMTQTRRTYAGPLQGPEDMLTIEIGENIDARHSSR
jgi:ribonuclease Z